MTAPVPTALARRDAPVLPPVRQVFRAVAGCVVPEATALPDAGWRELEGIVETALAARPRRMRRQLVLFLRLIDLASIARFGRLFRGLTPDRQQRVLRRFERSGALLLRRGFWGLRTLVYMGYYGRAAAAVEIGYRARARGWEAR